MATEKAILIINNKSRKGSFSTKEIEEGLKEAGIYLKSSYTLSNPKKIMKVLRREIKEGIFLVIAGGGDGTLNLISNEIAYKNLKMGVIPLGTNNSFAKSLKIPLTIPLAIETIAKGRTISLPLGKVENHYFINTISLGLSTEAANEVIHPLKRIIGPLSYGIAALKAFFIYPSFWCRLSCNHKSQDLMTRQLIISNGSYLGYTPLAPSTQITKNELYIFVKKPQSKLSSIIFWLRMFIFRKKYSSAISEFHTKEVKVETVPTLQADIDGETDLFTPFIVKVAPQALKVIVPI